MYVQYVCLKFDRIIFSDVNCTKNTNMKTKLRFLLPIQSLIFMIFM
jgi:hypothetical protein